MKFLALFILGIIAVQLKAEQNEALDDDRVNDNEAIDEDEDEDPEELDGEDEVLPKKSPSWSWRRRRRSPPTTPPEKRCKAPRRKGSQVCSMDGCSVKWVPLFFANVVFKKACDEHDCCYQFKTCSRKDCDLAFKANMLNSCTKRTGFCVFYSNLYYTAVRMFGWTSYGKVHGK